MTTLGVAVVTGASGGIGKATAQRLASDGFTVVCAARREEQVREVAQALGGVAVQCDVTVPSDVAELGRVARATAHDHGSEVSVLVNNAGGALGLDPVEHTNLEQMRTMWESNVAGMVAVTQELLPALRAGEGTIVTISSTAGLAAYEGGGAYCAAKAAESMMMDALRLELCGDPVRVCDVQPGMVNSDAFSLTRFGGDQAKADAVYAGVDAPLTQEDVAECVSWVVGLPPHVNIDKLLVRPRAQAANHKVFRHQ